ncbi:50S ribosomal protein L33 [Spiroplasma endosymbiont of Melieria omissa]
MNEKIILICTVCLNRNYHTYKNKIKYKERIELKKYCEHCQKHTLHKESR